MTQADDALREFKDAMNLSHAASKHYETITRALKLLGKVEGLPEGSWELHYLAHDGKKRNYRFKGFTDETCLAYEGYGDTIEGAIEAAKALLAGSMIV